MHSLRSILGLRSQDKITNLEIPDRAGTTSIEATFLKAQLRWTGNIIRMDEQRWSRKFLSGELMSGKRSQGRSRKRFKGFQKRNLKWFDIKPAPARVCSDGTIQLAQLELQQGLKKERCQRLTAVREQR